MSEFPWDVMGRFIAQASYGAIPLRKFLPMQMFPMGMFLMGGLFRDLNSRSSDYQSDPLTIQLQGRHTHSSVKLLLKFLMGQRHSHGNLEIFHGKLETSHGELLRLLMGNGLPIGRELHSRWEGLERLVPMGN